MRKSFQDILSKKTSLEKVIAYNSIVSNQSLNNSTLKQLGQLRKELLKCDDITSHGFKKKHLKHIEKVEEIDKTDVNVDNKIDFDIKVAVKYLNLQRSAQSRNIPFELKLDDVREIMSQKNCYYSGVLFDSDKHLLTFDRIDCQKPYTLSNVVACSDFVNQLKENILESHKSERISKHLTPAQFKNFIQKMVELL